MVKVIVLKMMAKQKENQKQECGKISKKKNQCDNDAFRSKITVFDQSL